MYGHGGTPPIRGTVTVIALRVLFSVAGLLSCGLFACLPLFQVALRRGRWFDWAAAWVTLPVSIGLLGIVGTLPESDPWDDVALIGSMVLSASCVAYYLVSDIRFHRAWRRSTRHAPFHVQTAHGPYGFPQPAPPAPPYPGVLNPQPQPYLPNAPMPQPPSRRAAPARIDQVRAELDELSDYLRKHEDPRYGGHEGGR
ncbi:hypothetical protein OHT01_23610 [Streptomyces sp. NBC_00358]